MSEEVKRRYQWLKGEKVNQIEVFTEEKIEKGITWLYFESGNRINKMLLTDYMLQLLPGQEGAANDLDISEINTDPTKTPAYKAQTNPLGEVTMSSKTRTVAASVIKSPIRELLEKASKAKNSERNITLKYKVFYPKKATYNVLKESFGVDVKKEVIDHIYDQIVNDQSFKKEMLKTIKELVNSTYDTTKK